MEKENNLLDYFSKHEKSGYFVEAMIDAKKLETVDHDLTKNHNFRNEGVLKKLNNLISRKNEVFFGIISGEEAIDTDQTDGNIVIPVICKEQILSKMKSINNKTRCKIAYLHISTIQMILKSTYSLGIESPITITLSDNRMINPTDALLATCEGNLKHGKIKFNLNYQVGMSLLDNNLDDSITLRWKMQRKIMKSGNHPFSVTWRINYALTNSHHSLSFKPSDKIEIDELFSPIIQLEAPRRTFQIQRTESFVRPRIEYVVPKKNDEEASSSSFAEKAANTVIQSNTKMNKLEQKVQKISKELGLPIE